MADKPKKFRTKLTAKSMSAVGEFTREGADHPTIIYGVEAISENGQQIDKKLRTFHEELPLDVLEEYEVEPYEHKDFGMTYTLKLLTKGRASKKDIVNLTTQVTDLASRVAAVEGEVQNLRAELNRERGFSKELDDKFGTKAPWDD